MGLASQLDLEWFKDQAAAEVAKTDEAGVKGDQTPSSFV